MPRRSEAERTHGPEAVWPYYYAGTMGLVMRDGINRLRHVKKYSGQFSTICTNMAWTGFIAGTGKLAGRRSARDGALGLRRDLGHEPGAHAGQRDDPCDAGPQGARRQDRCHRRLHERTMKQADMALLLNRAPTGRSPARSCMSCSATAMRTGPIWRSSRTARRSRGPSANADPVWASAITGLPVEDIEAFARLVGERKRTYLPPRLWHSAASATGR